MRSPRGRTRRTKSADTAMRLACDVGGTFTDLVLEDDAGRLRLFKSPTTPADPLVGLLAAVDLAAADLKRTRRDLLAGVATFRPRHHARHQCDPHRQDRPHRLSHHRGPPRYPAAARRRPPRSLRQHAALSAPLRAARAHLRGAGADRRRRPRGEAARRGGCRADRAAACRASHRSGRRLPAVVDRQSRP